MGPIVENVLKFKEIRPTAPWNAEKNAVRLRSDPEACFSACFQEPIYLSQKAPTAVL